MRSNYPILLMFALTVLLATACSPGTEAEVVTADDAETATSTPEEIGCKRIVYSYAVHGQNHFDENIVSVCPDGTDKVFLTTDALGNINPVWSPDGEKIAFISYQSGMPQLHVMNPDGSNAHQITFGPDTVNWNWFWLPDSEQIAMLMWPEGSYGGGGVDEEEEGEDGEEEGVVDDEEEEVIIEIQQYWQIVNIVSSEITLLTEWTDEIFFRSPRFSHDETRMVYLTSAEYVEGVQSTSAINIKNIDGTNAYTLISDIWSWSAPIWSYDDTQLAFTVDLAGYSDQFVIYTVNVDGSNLQRVSKQEFSQHIGLAWSPDGKSLIIYNDEMLSIMDIRSGVITMKLLSLEFPNHILGMSWQP